MRHIIRKQIVEAILPEQEQTNAVQIRLSRIFRERLIPIIEKVLDEVSGPNELVRIDSLEVDLGKIPLERLERLSEERFEQLFRKAIQEKIQKNRHSHSSSFLANNQSFFSTHPSAHKVKAVENQSVIEGGQSSHQSSHQSSSEQELLIYFIENGMLPWWAELMDGQKLQEMLQNWLEKSPASLAAFSERWLQLPLIRKRLIQTFSDEQLYQLLYISASAKSLDAIPLKGKALKDFLEQVPSQAAMRLGFWEESREQRGESREQRGESRELRSEMGDEEREMSKRKPEITNKEYRTRNKEVQTQDSKAGRRNEEDIARNEEEGTRNNACPERIRGEQGITNKEQGSPNQEPVSLLHEQQRHLTLNRFAESKEIYLFNSGLVLLWPYFQHVFTQLNWVDAEDKVFHSWEARHRAAHWLHGLATGQAEPTEHLMVLNKVLCGIPVQAPMEPLDPLAAEALEEGDSLLKAVIAQVPKMGDLSPDGFRGTFLLREGVLKPEANRWLLHVKTEPYDVLLKHIPWPYNFVKLPWMEHIMYVEWI